MQKEEAYAEEAFQQCAPDEIARVLAAINMESASPATLEFAGALQEALRIFREQTDAGRKTARGPRAAQTRKPHPLLCSELRPAQPSQRSAKSRRFTSLRSAASTSGWPGPASPKASGPRPASHQRPQPPPPPISRLLRRGNALSSALRRSPLCAPHQPPGPLPPDPPGLGGRVWESCLLLCSRLAASDASALRGASVLELGRRERGSRRRALRSSSFASLPRRSLTMPPHQRPAPRPLSVRHPTPLPCNSGCGVCGIFAALRGAKSVTLTDHHPAVLGTLRVSLSLNPTLPPASAAVAFLDWDNERAHVASPAQRPPQAGAAAAGSAGAGAPSPLLERAAPRDAEGKPFPVVEEHRRFDVILAADVLCAPISPPGHPTSRQHLSQRAVIVPPHLAVSSRPCDCDPRTPHEPRPPTDPPTDPVSASYESAQAMSLAAAIAHRLDPKGWCRVVVPVRSAQILEAFVEEARSYGLRVTTSPVDEAARAAALGALPPRRALSGGTAAPPPPRSSRGASPPPGALRSPRRSAAVTVVEVVEALQSSRPASPTQRCFAELEGAAVELDIDWGGELFGSQVLNVGGEGGAGKGEGGGPGAGAGGSEGRTAAAGTTTRSGGATSGGSRGSSSSGP